MINNQLQQALSTIKSKGGTVREKPCEDSQLVLNVQTELGIIFPEQFVEFHQTYKFLRVCSDEFVSIGRLAAEYAARPGLQRAKQCLFPVLDDGRGGWWYIVCRWHGKREPSEFGCILYVFGRAYADAEYESSDLSTFLISNIKGWEETL